MSTILGLDLSLTSTGWCVLESGKIKEKGVIKPKLKGMARLQYIKNAITTIVYRKEEAKNESLLEANRNAIKLIAIEGYSMGSRSGQAFSIGELGGIVKYFTWMSNTKIIIVPPASLKKFVAGKGNAPKDVMMMKTLAKYGIEFTDNNICDAYCLAKLGEAYLNGTDIKYEQEAIKKVEVLR